MRIAHFLVGRCNPDSANGVDKSVYYMTRAQAALGHEVSLFSLTTKPAIPIDGVGVRVYPPSVAPFSLPRSLLRDLWAWKPDVVHIHSVYVPANAALARKLTREGIPYVITPHGALNPHVLRRRAYVKRPYRLLFELPALNHAAFVHAIADGDNIRDYGVTNRIVVAPNGIDFGDMPTDLDKQVITRRFPALAGKRIAAFVGRLDPLHKGLDLLLQAFARTARTTDLALVLVGPDWRGGRDQLGDLAAHLGVGDRVVFWGPAYGKEKYDVLAGADFFVHTSRWEGGVPCAVLEALASGKPCLVTAAADPVGHISTYDAGSIVDSSPDHISAGLERLALSSRESLDAYGEHARELAAREFSWPRIAGTLVGCYAQYAARQQ